MSYIGNQPTSVAFLTDTFSGNGGTTFTMQVAPANTSSILVAITGIVQDPSTYSVVGTTLTFSQAPPVGTSNISVRYMGIPASGVTTTAYRTVTNFTATAAQTIFSVPSYTVGYIDVYRNGVRLAAADYTATNGTTVVLTNAATAGDSVVAESFYVSSVLNAIPATAGAVNTTYITDGAVVTSKVADAALTQAKLAANVAGNGPAVGAYATSNQSITANTSTKILFDTESFDTNSNFASSRFTPTVAGYYHIVAGVAAITGSTANACFADIRKNGAQTQVSGYVLPTGITVVQVAGIFYMNGSTDFIEIYFYQGGMAQTIFGRSDQTYFQAAMVRAA